MQWCLAMVSLWCLVAVLVTRVAVQAVEEALPWWKTATLYQVYPRSFKDSDGDGVGDLQGILQKADYFQELGVDAIWLSPIFSSPMVDSGYDISDFRQINPMFGTLEDFKQLVAKMKSLGIKLLIDMVMNHSSDQHPWFNLSLNRVEPYTDYYVWNDGKIDPVTKKRVPPNNWISAFTTPAWEWREERQQYYLHLFTTHQIDFDFTNELVKKEIDDILTYWLDLGVDGFRMDAAIFLVEGNYSVDEPHLPGQAWDDFPHPQELCRPEDYVLMDRWNRLIYDYSVRDGKDRAVFIEAYASDENTLKLYGHGNTRFASPFNFKFLMNTDKSTRATDMRDLIQGYLAQLKEDETPNWVTDNHDTPRAYNFGPESRDAMTMLVGALPGVRVVYYGEEIGMTDTFLRYDQLQDPGAKARGPQHYMEFNRDQDRTPMQWDDSTSAGFSTSEDTWLPVNPNYWWLNVAAQRAADRSHLKVFQDVSRVRRDPVLQRGSTSVMAPDKDTLVVIRSYNGSSYVYIYNMGSKIATFTSQNFFAIYNLDVPMSVEVVSTSCIIPKGTLLKQGSASLNLRPRSAILLRSPPSSTSSAAPRLATLSLLALGLMLGLLSQSSCQPSIA